MQLRCRHPGVGQSISPWPRPSPRHHVPIGLSEIHISQPPWLSEIHISQPAWLSERGERRPSPSHPDNHGAYSRPKLASR